MRDYYRPLPPPAGGGEASPPPRRRRPRAVAVLGVTAALLALAVVVLAVLLLTRPPQVWTGEWTPDLPPALQTEEGEPPAIADAPRAAEFSLPLVSSGEREVLSPQDNYRKNIDSIVGVYAFGESFGGFGTGVILTATPMANDTLLEIAFDKVGTKKLFANFARLTKG